MKLCNPSILAIAAALPVSVLAHYNFEALIVNGNVTSPYEFVRQTTNSNSPVEDVTSSDIICNQGGLDADIRAKTGTYTVSPGDEVGFAVNVEIGHPGPLAVYMSKAPQGTETSDYLGDGDWFKVYELTTSSITDAGLQWATYINNQGIHNFTFTLPDELPAGNYLMRAEHVGLHGAGQANGAQFYIGCAQLAVEGSGAGSPSPVVKFPGAYDGTEPGLLINIYYPAPTNYTAPGPVTWPKACEDHTANLEGLTSDGDCTGGDASGGDDGSNNGNTTTSSAAAITTTATVVPSVSSPSNATVPAISVPTASFPSNGTTSIPPVSSTSSGTIAVPTSSNILSTSVVPGPISSVTPFVTTSTVDSEPTSVVSNAPSTTTELSTCGALKRKGRKARRAAMRAAKRSYDKFAHRY